MMKHYCILLLLFVPALLSAQLKAKHVIYFDSNVSKLNKIEAYRLDSIIAMLNNIPEAFTVVVKGHTDNKGTKQLNEKLSRARAENVSSYLARKNFTITANAVSFHDFSSPAVENKPEIMWKNRRVEVSFYLRRIDMSKSLGITDADGRKYKFNEDSGGTVEYEATKIDIEPNSFIHKDGSDVTGEIDILYNEFRKPADFVLSRIPMSVRSGNEVLHFNSGGMFSIYAFQNGEELILKKQEDKKIRMNFPIENKANMNFYSFDTINHQWDPNAINMTDPHGNRLPGFVAPGTSNVLGGSAQFLACAGRDTCGKALYALNKLAYFITHEEPIRRDQPYKFLLNEQSDFKSSYYNLEVDKENKKIAIVPVNANSKLQKFADYEWTFANEKTMNRLLVKYKNGCSFVKVMHERGDRFNLQIGDSIIDVTGEPKGNVLSPSKLNKQTRKNYRKYTKYLKKQDKYTNALEEEVIKNTGMGHKELIRTYGDSLDCILYFYKAMVASDNDPPLVNTDEFNLNKKLIAKQLKDMPYPFTCNDVKKLIRKRDSLDRIALLIKNKASGGKQAEFANFGISSTGVFNADAVKRIDDPEVIIASYEDQQGEPLKIISVFLNLEKINGIIEYNGYMGYGPYKFVYGKNVKTMMIAADEKMRSYYCTAEEFAAFVGNAPSGNVKFKLKPLENLKTKDRLDEVMVK